MFEKVLDAAKTTATRFRALLGTLHGSSSPVQLTPPDLESSSCPPLVSLSTMRLIRKYIATMLSPICSYLSIQGTRLITAFLSGSMWIITSTTSIRSSQLDYLASSTHLTQLLSRGKTLIRLSGSRMTKSVMTSVEATVGAIPFGIGAHSVNSLKLGFENLAFWAGVSVILVLIMFFITRFIIRVRGQIAQAVCSFGSSLSTRIGDLTGFRPKSTRADLEE
uniref:Uncharacterized protein n=1 Tax=Riboviria sp. TaxID=2585031 RepID=A0A8K1U254_9VIRU|nr:MAG: hypothetical protein 1 [Riboviria sp.]